AVVYSQLLAQVSLDPIGVQDAVASDGNNSCNKTTTSALWVLADETGTSTTYSAQQQVPFKYDGAAPQAPSNVDAAAGNQAVGLTWSIDSKVAADIDGFQTLCATYDDQTPVFPDGMFKAGYRTVQIECGMAPTGGTPSPGSTSAAFLAVD